MLTKLKTYVKYTLIRKWKKEPHNIKMRIRSMELVAIFGYATTVPSSNPTLAIIKILYTNQSKEIFNSKITYHHWDRMKLSHYKNKRMLKY